MEAAVPMILFSQLPTGHVAVVVADRSKNGDVSEVFLKLSDVSARGSQPAKKGRMYSQRIKAESLGALVTDEEIAKRGADFANGEMGSHDPHAYALFPVDEEPSKYVVGSLRPALAVGRDFLDMIAKDSQVPEVKTEAKRLTDLLVPLPYGGIALEKVGVESDLVSLLHDDATGAFAVRAKFQLKQPRPPEALPEGDPFEVVITARVYKSLTQFGLPPVPDAEGPEVTRTARVNEWDVVDLPLPAMPARPEGYLVTAKVRTRDPRYRKNFEPSDCWTRKLAFPAG